MNLEFLGQKISKMGFCKYYQKSVHGAFLTFYKKLEQHKDLKLSQIIAFGIILFWDFRAKNWPKIRFFRYYQKPLHETILIFYMEVQ